MNYLEYWRQFERNCDFKLVKPSKKSSNYHALCPGNAPRTWVYASLHLGDDPEIKKSIGVGVSFTGANAEARYQVVAEQCQEEIARLQQHLGAGEIAANGRFFEQPGVGEAYCFAVRNETFDPENAEQWPKQHDWMCQRLWMYKGVFHGCICKSVSTNQNLGY